MRFFHEEDGWRQLFERSPEPCWILQDGRAVHCNEAAVGALGYGDRAEVLRLPPERLSPEQQPDGEDSASKARRMAALALEKGSHRFEWSFLKKDGGELPVEVTMTSLQSGEERYLHCSWRDISDWLEIRLRLEESEQHFRTLANSGSTLIWTSGTDMLCNYFNEPWMRFTGRTLEQEIGNGWAEGVHPDDLKGCIKTYIESFAQRKPFSMFYRLRNKDGEYRWLRDDGNPRYDTKGRFLGYIGYCMDAQRQMEYVDKIQSMAFYDPLTGLPNRSLLMNRLELALDKSRRQGCVHALFFLDLDGFKTVNDTLGHAQGDLLLREAAQRIQRCVRKVDTVSRFGGDEFVLLLEELQGEPEEAARMAQNIGEKILREFARPFALCGKEVVSTASIGLTLFQQSQQSASELIREADALMYDAKLKGKGRLSVRIRPAAASEAIS